MWTILTLMVVMMAPTIVSSFQSNFIHDSETTYCWHTNTSYTVARPSAKLITQSDRGSNCPIQVSTFVKENIQSLVESQVRWDVILDSAALGHNKIGLAHITSVVDKDTHTAYDVIHSNIHLCDFGSNCSPFQSGTGDLSPTPNRMGNFSTDAQSFASFTDQVAFGKPGVYSLVAHVVLAGPDETSRFDFATYTKVIVKGGSGPVDEKQIDSRDSIHTTENDGDKNSSTIVIVCVIVGVLVLIVLVGVSVLGRKRRRRERERMYQSTFRTQPPPFDDELDAEATAGNYGGGRKSHASRCSHASTATLPMAQLQKDTAMLDSYATVAAVDPTTGTGGWKRGNNQSMNAFERAGGGIESPHDSSFSYYSDTSSSDSLAHKEISI